MQKVIFLADMNAFFISCESTRHPEIAGRPAAVAGDPKKRTGIILAANYEARKFGVKTTMLVHEALKCCPDMILFPPDHGFYEKKSKEIMDILALYTPVVEQNSIDEAWLDMTGCENIFGPPPKTANKIMTHIKNELGLWCSIGISENKFLSKMASEMKKPLGITELWKKDVPIKLWPLPLSFMYGIGKQTAKKLNEMGLQTIGDLAGYSKTLLVKKFGKSGAELHDRANGIDPSPVRPHSANDMKSIGRSVTLPEDISDIDNAKAVLLQLSDEVGTIARNRGKKGTTVQLSIKYSDFKSITRQTAVPATFLVKDIYSAGIKLLEKNWSRHLPIRLLGISLAGFSDEPKTEQLSIFTNFEYETEKIEEEKNEKIEKAINEIRLKYGSSIINRAILFKKK